MSQNDNTDDHDVRDESMSQTTRRGLLGALGVAGLASLGSSGASANLGGGPEAGAMTDYQVPYFRVPESDLDTPGVVGRRVEISAGGSTYSAGDQLVDTGTSWERVSAGYDSVSTDELSNTYDFICSDSAELAEALDAASSEAGVKIAIGNGTFRPHQNGSSPWQIKDSTIIEGYHPGQDPGTAIDGMDPNTGTVIDLEGNQLFAPMGVDGIRISDIGAKNGSKFLEAGDADMIGLSHSKLENIYLHDFSSEYAITLYNHHQVDMDTVVQKRGRGLVEGLSTEGVVLAPGNSVWEHLRAAPSETITDAVIKLEAEPNSQYNIGVTEMIRPQVISASQSNSDGGAAILFKGNDSGAAAQTNTISGCNVEGDFQHHVRFINADMNYLQFPSPAGNPEWHVHMDADSGDNQIIGQNPVTVYSQQNTNWLWGEFAEVGGNRARGMVTDASESPNIVKLLVGLLGRAVEFDNTNLVASMEHALQSNGLSSVPRGKPTSSEISQDYGMVYQSDGSDGATSGDLVWAVNDGGTIKTIVLAQKSNATA